MTHTYKTNDPRGWGGDPMRGAALGREKISEPEEDTFKETLILQRVPIDTGGYDPNGTYFGALEKGQNLYWLASTDGRIDRTFRATDDHAAVAHARKLYPQGSVQTEVRGVPVEVGDVELDAFTLQYLQTAMRVTNDMSDERGGVPLDRNYSIDDLDESVVANAKRDCEEFQKNHAELLATAYQMRGYDETDAGYDFWVSRNEYGVGFDDRGLGACGEALQKAARACGSVELYVGDDGVIYE